MLKQSVLCSLLVALAIMTTGSTTFATEVASSPSSYTLEPPDIIRVEEIHLVPKAPHQLRTLDVIWIKVIGTPVESPIDGHFAVEPDGVVQLGSDYGNVQVTGLTVEAAQAAIRRHLAGTDSNAKGRLINPEVSVRLLRIADLPIAGNHIIDPAGYITFGIYGRVHVSGLTLDECRDAIELHLSKYFEHPQVATDIYKFNSKWYYVVYKFTSDAIEDEVIKFPYTGNERVSNVVANAVGAIGGLTPNTPLRIWIERTEPNSDKPVILPVDWEGIIIGRSGTNYKIRWDDRVHMQHERWRFRPFGGALARGVESIKELFVTKEILP
jgi:protein involved in polysaccharide export with SLBB domain